MKTTGLLTAVYAASTKNKLFQTLSSFVLLLMVSLPTFSQLPCYDYQEPTIYCRQLHTAFMPGVCMVEVWAKDLISKASDNKTAEEDLIIAFDAAGTIFSKTFFSEQGTIQNVAVYVIDECGNTAVCIIEVFINDNEGTCPTECPIDVNPWCGYAVITCSAEKCPDQVAAIIDTRFNSQCPLGDNWADPVTPGADPVPFIRPPSWSMGTIGAVFGIAIKPVTGDIFFSATDMYAYNFQQYVHVGFPPPTCTGSGGSAGIYMTSFGTPNEIGAIITTSSSYLEANEAIGGSQIPNSGNFIGDPFDCGSESRCELATAAEIMADTKIGNGIGNIAYDPKSNHLFASNLEDGKIYSINLSTNTITDVFDPKTENGFTAYNHAVEGDGLANQTDRIWGVQINSCSEGCQLYFAREAEGTPDQVDIIKPKEIYSVEINLLGYFVGTEKLEFIVDRGDEVKITDLAFNSDCSKLLVAEKGNTHSAEVTEYMLDGEDWVFNKQIFVGINDPGPSQNPTYPQGIVGNSSSGGVSYGAKESQNVVDAECDSLIYATASCLDVVLLPTRCDAYGLEIVSAEGNAQATNKSTDCFIDFDPDFTDNPFRFKGNLGEVEVFNCCCLEDEGRDLVENATIAGNIKTSRNHFIPDVKVNIKSDLDDAFIMTSSNGSFVMKDRKMYADYHIAPEKEGSILDGLSTLDMLILQKHVLGIRKLTNPYDIIASDVDESASVTTKDLIYMRQVILGMETSFPSQKSWVFVPADYAFSDNQNPFPFTSEMVLEDLKADYMKSDFIGIKLGDLDGNNTIDKSAQPRNVSTPVSINVAVEKRQGQSKIVFRASSFDEVAGMQFTLEGLENIQSFSILPGKLSVSEANMNQVNDMAKFSWISSQSINVEEGDILFTIITNDEIGDEVYVGSSMLKAEAYDNNLYVRSLESITLPSTYNRGVQGYPNPFAERHIISFNLDEEADVSIEVYNQNGQLLVEREMRMFRGEQQISLSKKDLGASYTGMIFYQLKIGNEFFNGKLLVIE